MYRTAVIIVLLKTQYSWLNVEKIRFSKQVEKHCTKVCVFVCIITERHLEIAIFAILIISVVIFVFSFLIDNIIY